MKPIAMTEREPTPEEHQTIAAVHALTRDWQGGLPLTAVRTHTSAHDRWIATRFTPPEHVMFRPLMAMLNALIATDVTDRYGWQYQTKHGTFSETELRATNATITRTDTGRVRIRFPEGASHEASGPL